MDKPTLLRKLAQIVQPVQKDKPPQMKPTGSNNPTVSNGHTYSNEKTDSWSQTSPNLMRKLAEIGQPKEIDKPPQRTQLAEKSNRSKWLMKSIQSKLVLRKLAEIG